MFCVREINMNKIQCHYPVLQKLFQFTFTKIIAFYVQFMVKIIYVQWSFYLFFFFCFSDEAVLSLLWHGLQILPAYFRHEHTGKNNQQHLEEKGKRVEY